MAVQIVVLSSVVDTQRVGENRCCGWICLLCAIRLYPSLGVVERTTLDPVGVGRAAAQSRRGSRPSGKGSKRASDNTNTGKLAFGLVSIMRC